MTTHTSEKIIKIAVIIVLMGLVFPFPRIAFGPALDPSWTYAVNAAKQNGLTFGKDIVFTYGPYTHLIAPYGTLNGHSQFLIAVATWMLWLFLMLSICTKLPFHRWVPAAGLCLLLPLYTEPTLLALGVFLSCLLIRCSTKSAYLIALFTSALCILSLHIKFSTGITMCSALGTALLTRTFINKQMIKPLWLIATLSALAVLLTIIVCTFHGLQNWISWLTLSFSIADGYASAMSLCDNVKVLYIGMICIIAMIAVALTNYIKSEDRYVFFPAIIPILIFYRCGFVRQDSVHVMNFYIFAILITCLLSLLVRKTSSYMRVMTLGLVLLIACIATASSYRWEEFINIETLTGARTCNRLKVLLKPDGYWDSVKQYSHQQLTPVRLPDPSIGGIISEETTVDVIPYHTAIIEANGYLWKPAPIFQHYSAYNVLLDGKNSAHYASTNSADAILTQFIAIDGRHMLWDCPKTWQTIFAYYQVEKNVDQLQALVLTKRTKPTQPVVTDLDLITVNEQEWIEIPKISEILYAKLNLKYSFSGSLEKRLFSISPINIQVRFNDDSLREWRLVPETCSSGIIMNYIPTSIEELAALMQGKAERTAVAFRITGPGISAFHFPANLQWMTNGSEIEQTNK